MLIIMAGLPFSGKTMFVKALVSKLNDLNCSNIVVDPTNGYPDEIDSYAPDIRSAISIAAWEIALDTLVSTIAEYDDHTVIILDTTGSNSSALTSIIDRAVLRKHKTMLVKVIAQISDCKERAGDKWVGDDVCKKYEFRMATNVEHLIGICDSYVPVLNINKIGALPALRAAEDLAVSINRQIKDK